MMVTLYGKNFFMDHLFHTGNAQSLPNKYYIALSTTTPTSTGTNFSEPAIQKGYSRVELSGLTNASGGTVSNGSVISFAESLESWGTITHWGLYDSSARGSGNLIIHGELEAPRVVGAETTLSFKVGYLTLSLVDSL